MNIYQRDAIAKELDAVIRALDSANENGRISYELYSDLHDLVSSAAFHLEAND